MHLVLVHVEVRGSPLELNTAKRRQVVRCDEIGWGETFPVLDTGVEIVVQLGTMEARQGQERCPSLAVQDDPVGPRKAAEHFGQVEIFYRGARIS